MVRCNEQMARYHRYGGLQRLIACICTLRLFVSLRAELAIQNLWTYSPNIAGSFGSPVRIFGSNNSGVLSPSEFLIHAADVEGLCQGIDELLVQSEWFTMLLLGHS